MLPVTGKRQPMRGHPFLRFLLTLLLLSFLGLGVWRLTSRKSFDSTHAAKSTTQKTSALTTVTIILTASQPWEKCQVHFLDQILIDAKFENNGKAQIVQLPLAQSATDIVIDASWKDAENHALRIQALNQDNPFFETSLWGKQTLQEAVSIPAQP
ncbi:MAG: hypothetical protein ABIP97_05845 [Chthoniobacterales bacterium]